MPGFFEQTLPSLSDHRWALIRLDGDTYDATRFSLEALYGGLAAGGYVIVDDYFQIDPCREAVDDFRRERGITEAIEQIDWSGARWRRAAEPESDERRISAREPRPAASALPQAVARGAPARVMAFEEVELRHQLTEVEARLAAAQAELERLVDHPLRGPRAWLIRRLRRILGGRA